MDELFNLYDEGCKAAQTAANEALKPYGDKIFNIIKEGLPKGHRIITGNAIAIQYDENDNEVAFGRGFQSYSRAETSQLMDFLGVLQYALDYKDCRIDFSVPNEIKAK